MKNNILKTMPIVFCFILALTGCDKINDNPSGSVSVQTTAGQGTGEGGSDTTFGQEETSVVENEENTNAPENVQQGGGTLNVCFGDRNKPFTLYLYDNPTAAAIKKHVGTADWQLPIYHYNDYDNWEVMQYYDVPLRYEIPSVPENIESEKAGEVFYSEPNRIVLFYGNAQVSGEYTKVGYFDFTEDFKSAVENNPVLEGWGNKLVFIQPSN